MEAFSRVGVVALFGIALGIGGCGGSAGPGPATGDKKASGPNAWLFGEWDLCTAGNAASDYARRGTSRDGCADTGDSYTFGADGKWTHGKESGSFSVGPATSACKLPEKAVGLAGTVGTLIAIWVSDNRITLTTPCLT